MRLTQLYLAVRGIPKTLLFNARYFGVRGILHPPVLVSHRVKLLRLEGSVEVAPGLGFAAIRIGFGNVGIFDAGRSRSIWENGGKIRFLGRASLGHGSRISVERTGSLQFGAGFTITAESTIACAQEVSFGSDCLVSWQVLIMDHDFHTLCDENGTRMNQDAPIRFGDRVWVCCRSLIFKGAQIPSGSVVAAASSISSAFEGRGLLIAGQPGRVVRTGIQWSAA